MKKHTSSGTLYGVGVGPGDPELITVKGLRLLQSVPVVAFPAGVRGQPGMAQQMIAPWLKPTQVQLALGFPYTQDDAVLMTAWQTAAETVWPYLEQGRDVVFVSAGDISFYSTFTYLAQTLQSLHADVQIEAIPGVCSPMAAASVLGIPLTSQSQRLAILPALYAIEELEAALNWADVVVLLKVSSVYDQVWSVLKQYKLLMHSYVVEKATQPDQVIYADLSDRPDLKLPYFSLLIIQVKPAD
ncbi:MAG: precorrin-2 C(20)-methyltransferase [Cyanothece sp. SIO1E1]|nr:precorrin-2 C(20)-methyltransferase [Cyanothece sp. SIO1E1]